MDRRVVVLIVAMCGIFLGVGVWIAGRAKPNESLKAVEKNNEDTRVKENDWVKGEREAPITIIEYGDFQCPACAAYYPLLKRLVEDFPGKVKVVYRQYPLTQTHDKAFDAARATEAAGRQGKFWEMHDSLFENQSAWSRDQDYKKRWEEYAGGAGVVVEKWLRDMEDTAVGEKIQADRQSGDRLGVTGTPAFWVNGVKIDLPGSYENFKKVIDGELQRNPTSPSATLGAQEVHMHFDVAVYKGGRILDLSGEEYMEKDERVHFHDGNGEVAHIHREGATAGMLIDSLGIAQTGTVSMMVDGTRYTGDWKGYEPADLDRVAVVFGSGPANVQVTDKACIYSEKCPERGKPPAEECVGGLDTPCE